MLTNQERKPEEHEGLDGRALSGAFMSRVVFVVGVAVLAVALGALVWHSAHLLLLIFAGILLAVFLCALSGWVRSVTNLGHGWALSVATVGFFAVAGLSGWFLADQISGQMGKLAKILPDSIQSFREWVDATPIFQNLGLGIPPAEQWLSGGDGLADKIGGFVSVTLGFPVTLLIIFFIGFFLAPQPDLYRRGLLKLMPPRRRARVAEVLDEVGEALKWWLLGMIVTMLLIGVLVSAGLAILGVPLPLALGLLSMILTFIPNFGPIASAILAILLAFTVGPTVALYTLILFVVVQGVESYVITPLIQRRAVKLPPALTIAAQVLMGTLAGALGLVLATPLAAAVLVMVKRLYVEDALGDEVE